MNSNAAFGHQRWNRRNGRNESLICSLKRLLPFLPFLLFKRQLFIVVALSVSAACSSKSAAPAPAAASLPPGIDVAGIDKSVAAGDDFNAYANGGWNKIGRAHV